VRDRTPGIDELFARSLEDGTPFELLRDDDVSCDEEPGPAGFTVWKVRGGRDAVELEAWDENEDLPLEDAPSDDEDPSDDDDFVPDQLEHPPIVPIAPLAEAEPSFAQHQVYGEARAYGAALVRLLPYLRQQASRIAGGDPWLEGDLTQEALIELWEMDASRFDEDDQVYLKRALVHRMIDAAERAFMQEMLVPQARARAFVRLRHEIGSSIHELGPHRPFTFSDSEET
jgi:ABC-type transporter Mla MlaB component